MRFESVRSTFRNLSDERRLSLQAGMLPPHTAMEGWVRPPYGCLASAHNYPLPKAMIRNDNNVY